MADRRVVFGQVVVGPPGSGKTTYCSAVRDLLVQQKRKVCLVNLDPASDAASNWAQIDIRQLITVEDVMESHGLGPNGALVYCMEFLERNIDWLLEALQANHLADHYLLLDLPGQVELLTHHRCITNVVERLQKWGLRPCCVHLVDSHYCSDASKFISVLLMTLTSMLHLAMPQVNVLSKVDLAERYGRLRFGLDFYTDVLDLEHLLDDLDDDPFARRHAQLSARIIDVVENYSLVSFMPLTVHDAQSLMKVSQAVDRANGYVYGAAELRNSYALFSSAVAPQLNDQLLGSITEKYLDPPLPTPSQPDFMPQ